MDQQRLGEYLEGVVSKRLAPVEVDPSSSNQHEFNSPRKLTSLFGTPDDKLRIPTRFIYLDDEHDPPLSAQDSLTLYDARKDDPDRSEFRVYYRNNAVIDIAQPGDLLVIAKKPSSNAAIAVVAAAGSSAEAQVRSLFSVQEELGPGFTETPRDEIESQEINAAKQIILEALEIDLHVDDELIDRVAGKFGHSFPTTAKFSAFARSTLPSFDLEEDPDGALVAWMEREELLFAGFSRRLVGKELDKLILESSPPRDPEPFQKLMLTHQNRAKSRAGHALENHLSFLFSELGVAFAHGAVTENRSKPDFLFPSVEAYRDPSFEESGLTMLAAKRTLKDRWRQVLAEADRIGTKHLITLQAPISVTQTDEMRSKNLRLVVPKDLHNEFAEDQRAWLLTLDDFIRIVRPG